MMNGPTAYGASMTNGDLAPEETAELGQGVQQDDSEEATEEGFTCLGKMPVTGGFFTRASKHGQP